jgi:hypothetical protein
MVSTTPRPRFTPGERIPGTHWIWGRVGPRVGLEEKSSASVGDWTSVVQSVVSHYTDWATPAQIKYVDTVKLYTPKCKTNKNPNMQSKFSKLDNNLHMTMKIDKTYFKIL